MHKLANILAARKEKTKTIKPQKLKQSPEEKKPPRKLEHQQGTTFALHTQEVLLPILSHSLTLSPTPTHTLSPLSLTHSSNPSGHP
jgi:hypothetical protein